MMISFVVTWYFFIQFNIIFCRQFSWTTNGKLGNSQKAHFNWLAQFFLHPFTRKTRYSWLTSPSTVLFKILHVQCTLGWVNFSEFEITVCGSCKMSKKLKWPFFLFFLFYFVQKSVIIFPPPYIVKLHFCKCLKSVLTNLRVRNLKKTIIFQNFTVFRDFLHT